MNGAYAKNVRGGTRKMLANSMVAPTLPAVDLKRARGFYEGKLGLKVVMEDPSPGIMIQAGKGTMLYVYQRAATKADHTVASFAVDDVEAEVKALKAKGVKFEDYDIPSMGIKTVNSIATMGKEKSAWFKDTEGNILALMQLPK
jgi:predicted enzyme related to lactoylglutathione lyase